MAERQQTALSKMQEIANKLILNTPELANILDHESALRPKKGNSPVSKKNPKGGHTLTSSNQKSEMTSNDYFEKCKELNL